MKNTTIKDFQKNTDKYLIRHKSILDIMTKYQESAARVNRSLAKSVTECGCLKITAQKQNAPQDIAYTSLKDYMSSHTEGTLCPHCRDNLTKELGHVFFYMAALCNLTGLSMEEVMQQENNNISTLGYYYLS
ncbi:MAG TPA: DUF1573 domain-containing protein [Candidatus Avacidaminococcus intestinavium]|uniref:DUF1573 domain-containing protein n=1 Tax=Candidatus Avacidaminococcus intestinavium TaxID=2840684 RepID=A0A9D1MPL9_9FIRM|nr:DUF1573 domain-containing protein [Candidatus Avacidaminococcus intestinavium]